MEGDGQDLAAMHPAAKQQSCFTCVCRSADDLTDKPQHGVIDNQAHRINYTRNQTSFVATMRSVHRTLSLYQACCVYLLLLLIHVGDCTSWRMNPQANLRLETPGKSLYILYNTYLSHMA